MPSLFHSSVPLLPSSAAKNSVPFTFTRQWEEEPPPGSDVQDEDGAGGGAVAFPQLIAAAAVIGGEEQRAVHIRQGFEWGSKDSVAGEDVQDEGGAGAVPSLFHSS